MTWFLSLLLCVAALLLVVDGRGMSTREQDTRYTAIVLDTIVKTLDEGERLRHAIKLVYNLNLRILDGRLSIYTFSPAGHKLIMDWTRSTERAKILDVISKLEFTVGASGTTTSPTYCGRFDWTEALSLPVVADTTDGATSRQPPTHKIVLINNKTPYVPSRHREKMLDTRFSQWRKQSRGQLVGNVFPIGIGNNCLNADQTRQLASPCNGVTCRPLHDFFYTPSLPTLGTRDIGDWFNSTYVRMIAGPRVSADKRTVDLDSMTPSEIAVLVIVAVVVIVAIIVSCFYALNRGKKHSSARAAEKFAASIAVPWNGNKKV